MRATIDDMIEINLKHIDHTLKFNLLDNFNNSN